LKISGLQSGISAVVKEYADIEIIECLRNRQSYVVRYLSVTYMPMIRLMVTRMGGTVEDAKDVFQEGLMIMIEKTDDRIFSLNCSFKTFLYCVCKHLWESVIEKRAVASNYFTRRIVEEGNTDIAEEMDNKIYRAIFREAFDSLDQVSRDVLTLYWEEITPQEIAGKLGFTYGYVRKKKSQAQAELIEKVKNHPEFIKIRNEEETLV
jgi:RNA polymerase sigma factor (sigma-70 family)